MDKVVLFRSKFKCFQQVPHFVEQLKSIKDIKQMNQFLTTSYSKEFPQIFQVIESTSNLKDFQEITLPVMIKNAVSVLEEKTQSPLLTNGSMSLTREQLCGYLSLMYFGIIKKEEETQQDDSMPHLVDMHHLFNNGSLQKEKLKCMINYFTQYAKHENEIRQEEVVFNKIVITPQFHIKKFSPDQNNLDVNYWQTSDAKLVAVECSGGKIEDVQRPAMLVDFADPYIGGLTWHGGNCAQEEVLMLIFPEALVSMLFTTRFENNSAMYIDNLIQFNNYVGYERTFQFKYREFKNIGQCMVAIDAINYNGYENQQSPHNILRELNKAFIGFALTEQQQDKLRQQECSDAMPYNFLSTGKWGCGIFRGNPELKTLIQWAAFSQARKNCLGKHTVLFNCFNDIQYLNFVKDLKKLEGKTVGELIQSVLNK